MLNKIVIVIYIDITLYEYHEFVPIESSSRLTKKYIRMYLINAGTLSINNEHFSKISIYPNPTNDFIKITNLNTETEITVFNSLGQKVQEVTIQNNENIDVSKLSKGVYYIKIDNKKGVKFIKK